MNTLPEKESLTAEFKTSFNEDVIETLVAFCNAKGGTVYVGVSDKGKAVGVTIGTETIQQWINEIKNKTSPKIIPDAEELTIDNKNVISLYVQEYPIKPVSTRGKYYKRVGNSNHLLSPTEVANMHLQTVNSSWDYYPRPNKTIHDISLEKVERIMNIIKRRDDNFQFENAREFLIKNELLFEDDRISNGCFLMFSKGENLYTTVQMGHFASEILIKDDVVNSDDILTQVEEVMQFLRKHISKSLIITDTQVENIQRWQYPLDALREIVLNMIIHRDYTAASNSIIKVFPDHILFYNPGVLPDTITLEQLKTNQYISTPRNRQIAKVAKEMGIIERYGTGIRRVRKMFTDYGLEEPKYEVVSGGMYVTVFGLIFEENNEEIPPDETVEENVKKVGNRVGNRVGNNITKNQQLILNCIDEKPHITIVDLSLILGISTRKIEANIQKIKAKGLIERIGTRKEGYWKINEKETKNDIEPLTDAPENDTNNDEKNGAKGTSEGTNEDAKGTDEGTKGTNEDTKGTSEGAKGTSAGTNGDTKGTNEGAKGTSEGTNGGTKGTSEDTDEITENQQKIIDNILKNPYITSDELSVIVGIRADKIRVNISKLKAKGLIERIGTNRGGHWKIKNEN